MSRLSNRWTIVNTMRCSRTSSQGACLKSLNEEVDVIRHQAAIRAMTGTDAEFKLRKVPRDRLREGAAPADQNVEFYDMKKASNTLKQLVHKRGLAIQHANSAALGSQHCIIYRPVNRGHLARPTPAHLNRLLPSSKLRLCILFGNRWFEDRLALRIHMVQFLDTLPVSDG